MWAVWRKYRHLHHQVNQTDELTIPYSQPTDPQNPRRSNKHLILYFPILIRMSTTSEGQPDPSTRQSILGLDIPVHQRQQLPAELSSTIRHHSIGSSTTTFKQRLRRAAAAQQRRRDASDSADETYHTSDTTPNRCHPHPNSFTSFTWRPKWRRSKRGTTTTLTIRCSRTTTPRIV